MTTKSTTTHHGQLAQDVCPRRVDEDPTRGALLHGKTNNNSERDEFRDSLAALLSQDNKDKHDSKLAAFATCATFLDANGVAVLFQLMEQTSPSRK